MRFEHDPNNADESPGFESDATDGGWDPYVTNLLMGGLPTRDASPAEDDDERPVMTFSRTPASR